MRRRCLGQGRSTAGARGQLDCYGVAVAGAFFCFAILLAVRLEVVLMMVLFRDAFVRLSVLLRRCSHGTGTQFPHNPHAEEVLVELAAELVRLEDD